MVSISAFLDLRAEQNAAKGVQKAIKQIEHKLEREDKKVMLQARRWRAVCICIALLKKEKDIFNFLKNISEIDRDRLEKVLHILVLEMFIERPGFLFD